VPASECVIMSWCGMRGLVSLAAALALPLTLADGTAFPHRDLIIFFTFIVIAVTLVVQGLTLAPLIRCLNAGADWSAREEEDHARRALGAAAVSALESLAAVEQAPPDLVDRLRAEFSEDSTTTTSQADPRAEMARRLRKAAIRAERQALLRLWRQQQIGDEVLHRLEENLDYKEARL
jgi:CPA1 family monovalent cation:H+ antiporter